MRKIREREKEREREEVIYIYIQRYITHTSRARLDAYHHLTVVFIERTCAKSRRGVENVHACARSHLF